MFSYVKFTVKNLFLNADCDILFILICFQGVSVAKWLELLT